MPRPPYSSVTHMSHISTEASARCLSDIRVHPISTERPPRCLFAAYVRPMSIVPLLPYSSVTHMRHISTEASARCLFGRCVRPMNIFPVAVATIEDSNTPTQVEVDVAASRHGGMGKKCARFHTRTGQPRHQTRNSAYNPVCRKLQKVRNPFGFRTFIRGARGIRTPDPLHAMEMRYQLRHSPVS